MSARRFLEPGPDHPITITDEPAPARARARGAVIAEGSARILQEARYAPVCYFDPAALSGARLEPSDKRSWCPYKGEAVHFHLVHRDGTRTENAVWSYPTPHAGVAAIAGLIAFYPNAIDAVETG